MRVHPKATILTTLVLSGACTVTPAPSTSGPVPLAYGDAASFRPLVPVPAAAPTCMRPTNAPVPPGARAVAMLYAGPPERQVTVIVDGEGTPIRYLDVRGDLSESDGDVGDRTTIGLYLEQGYAVLSNRAATGAPDILEVPLDDVVSSPRLGNPDAVMSEVLENCARVN